MGRAAVFAGGWHNLEQSTRVAGATIAAGVASDVVGDHILGRPRPLRFFAESVAELTRRATREGTESVQPAQFGKMLVLDLGPHRVVGDR